MCIRRFLIGWACVLVVVTLSLAETATKSQKQTLTFGPESRTYYVFAPSGLSGPAPLLLLLHGSGQDGKSLIDVWEELARREGIILVAPDSRDPAEWDY